MISRARWAVLMVFFTNGAGFATWAPRIPTVQADLGLDAGTLGLALGGGGLGGLIFTLFSGMMVDRFGSHRVLPVAVAGFGVCLVGGVLCAVTLWLCRGLLPREPSAPGTATAPGLARPTTGLLLLGLLVLAAAFIEDVPLSWSAVYLTELGTGPGQAGLAFVAFSVCMAAGRFAGDRLVDRFGPVRVLVCGALLTAAAFGLSLLFSSPIAAIIGFALVGLGASPIFPVAFSLVVRLSEAATGAGIAVVSLISRAGFLIAPLAVGALADTAGFRPALSVVCVAGVVVALAALRVRRELARAGEVS